MQIPVKVQHGLVILGVVVLGYILLVPKNKKSKNNSPKVAEDSKVKNLQNAKVVLDKNITVLGFPGSNIDEVKANLFNLNQKIYNKYGGFKDFQMVMILPAPMWFNITDLVLAYIPMAFLAAKLGSPQASSLQNGTRK